MNDKNDFMKKYILFLLFFFNLVLAFENGRISLQTYIVVHAQSYNEEGQNSDDLNESNKELTDYLNERNKPNSETLESKDPSQLDTGVTPEVPETLPSVDMNYTMPNTSNSLTGTLSGAGFTSTVGITTTSVDYSWTDYLGGYNNGTVGYVDTSTMPGAGGSIVDSQISSDLVIRTGSSDGYVPNISATPPTITPSTTLTYKQPEIRTDCPESATTHSNNVNNILQSTLEIVENMTRLVRYVYQPLEYGIVIQNISGMNSIYQSSKSQYLIQVGGADYINMEGSLSANLDVHTHTDDCTKFNALSWADIYSTLKTNATINIGQNGSYLGGIALGRDGAQYLSYIEDKNAANNFLNNYRSSFYVDKNDNDKMKLRPNSDLFIDYKNVYKSLFYQGYSLDNAQSYAIAYVLSKFNSGIKLSIKPSGSSNFRELKTEQNPMYIPSGSSDPFVSVGLPVFNPSICPQQ
jgi:hypothetical protein